MCFPERAVPVEIECNRDVVPAAHRQTPRVVAEVDVSVGRPAEVESTAGDRGERSGAISRALEASPDRYFLHKPTSPAPRGCLNSCSAPTCADARGLG